MDNSNVVSLLDRLQARQKQEAAQQQDVIYRDGLYPIFEGCVTVNGIALLNDEAYTYIDVILRGTEFPEGVSGAIYLGNQQALCDKLIDLSTRVRLPFAASPEILHCENVRGYINVEEGNEFYTVEVLSDETELRKTLAIFAGAQNKTRYSGFKYVLPFIQS